jgi:hypothetical protein
MPRQSAHPAVAAGLAEARLSPSWARAICEWSDLLPEEDRARADEILVDAAAGCAEIWDVRLAWERIRALCAQPDVDDGDDRFAQRRLHLQPHFEGNARLDADLTPEAAAAVQAVLDTLGKRTGPEDVRTRAQRDHDALEEACRLLIASGGLPDRAGQPVQIQLSMTLSQLMGAPEADAELAAWIVAHGAPAPPGADCHASIVPVITGILDPDTLDQLAQNVRDRHGQVWLDQLGQDTPDQLQTKVLAQRAARQVTIAQAVRLLSGPSGLAAWMRARQLSGPAGSASLPLDIGAATETIPPHRRRAVARRDRHCRLPGCERPPAACHVHHLIIKSQGGRTSLGNCALLCPFHHLVVIHRWGWILVLNRDGTTTATSPDGQRTLHSHAPPVAA